MISTSPMIASVLALVIRVWDSIADYIKNKPLKDLKKLRKQYEAESRQAQLNGDLNELRKCRAKIEDIDNRIESGDY